MSAAVGPRRAAGSGEQDRQPGRRSREGTARRRAPTSDLAAATGLPLEDFQAAAANFTSFGVPAEAPSLEGFLFPATYTFDPGIDGARRCCRQLVDDDVRSTSTPRASRPRTGSTVLTLASIIQREAGPSVDDMHKIARVFQNRLDQGMHLQSDATVAYGTGNTAHGVDDADAERADASNPYNTYANPGCRSARSGCPGDAAIDARLHPADGPWLYFVPVNLQDRRDGVLEDRRRARGRRRTSCRPGAGRAPRTPRTVTDAPRSGRTARRARVADRALASRRSCTRPPTAVLGLDWSYERRRGDRGRARRLRRRAATRAGAGCRSRCRSSARCCRLLADVDPIARRTRSAPRTRCCSTTARRARLQHRRRTASCRRSPTPGVVRLDARAPSSAGERPPRRCWRSCAARSRSAREVVGARCRDARPGRGIRGRSRHRRCIDPPLGDATARDRRQRRRRQHAPGERRARRCRSRRRSAQQTVLLDVAYDPWPSALAAAWPDAGGTVVQRARDAAAPGGRARCASSSTGDPDGAAARDEVVAAMRAAVGLRRCGRIEPCCVG